MSDVRAALGPFLLVLGCSAALAAPAREPEIAPQAIAAHVAVIADDSFGGRAPGTEGEAKTRAYISAAFRKAHLEPLAGGSFSLPVPLQKSIAISGAIVVGGKMIANGDDAFVRAPNTDGKLSATGEVVFAGYGIRDAATGRDDFAGMDFKDRIALVLAGPPPGALPTTHESATRSAKLKAALDVGARAAVMIYAPEGDDKTWPAVRGLVSRDTVTLPDASDDMTAVTAVLGRAGGEALAAALGTTLGELSAAAIAPGFQPKPLGSVSLEAENRIERLDSANVAGVLRGRQMPDEYVVYVAHWDHLGRCVPAAPDPICNGAVDNASGVGGLIELAKAFAHGKRPKRSVIFLASTAEESGLLGARFFARSGPVPASRMVAAFGLDTIAANGPSKDVIVLGEGLSTIDQWLDKAAKAEGRRLLSMPGVQSFYKRSDHFAFAEAGVPAVIATGIFAAGGKFQDYMRDHYHEPSDEVSRGIDYSGAADDVQLILAAGRAIANSRERPVWTKSSSYQRAK